MATVQLTCPECGGDQFIHPDNANLESRVKCASCGLEGVAGDLIKPQALEEAKRLAVEALRSSFGNRFKGR